MAKSFSFSKNPGMALVATYTIMYVVNVLILFIANMFFPAQVVLGTASITPMWAIFHSMSILALILTLLMPFFYEIERMMGRELSMQEWIGGYLVINFASIWLITRFSEQFGLGLSSWLIVLILAAVMNLVQGLAMMQFGKIQKKYK